MLNNILNLGKALSKAEQKSVFGGEMQNPGGHYVTCKNHQQYEVDNCDGAEVEACNAYGGWLICV